MKKKRKSYKPTGIINGFLHFLSEKALHLLKNGMLGRIFSTNNKLEDKASKGILVGALSDTLQGKNNGLRRYNLKSADNSFFINIYRKILNFLCNCSLNWYGIYFLTFAFYTLLIYVFNTITLQGSEIELDLFLSEYFICPIFVAIASIPLLNCKQTLQTATYSSKIVRPVLRNFCGVPENKFNVTEAINKSDSYFVSIILGILTGGITHFISPTMILLGMLVLFGILLFMSFPELGLLISIFAVPFLSLFERPTVILLCMISVNAISYICKVFIGKRSFRFRMSDAIVLIFGLLFLFGGIITSGTRESLNAAITYALLTVVYFLVVNLFNTREWIERCITAIAIPSVIVSLYGILSYATVKMPTRWIDSEMFSEISSRAVSVFSNPNMLATYLILTAPFIWIFALKSGASKKSKFLALLCALISAICIVLTWSRGGWLGLIAGFLLFLLINYRHSLKLLLITLISSPIWYKLIPKTIISRFLSIGNLADSSTYYRLYTWKGSIKLLIDYLWGGIGVGSSAFEKLYPLYSYIGTESTAHSHNLFLQIAIELGIFALVVFLIVVFLTFQTGFTSLKNSDSNIKLFVSASIAGVFAALVHGMVDYIWYNYRVFFVFWIVLSVVSACGEIVRQETFKKNYSTVSAREQTVSLDIVFGN